MRIHDWKMELYWRLPVALQEVALSLYARQLHRLYFGPGFAESVQECLLWKRQTREEARSWQDQRLSELVQLAATEVPHYRKAWKEVAWRSVRRVDDLKYLPLLDKQVLRTSENQFLRAGVSRKHLWSQRTSGTTGTSLTIYWPRSMVTQCWAINEIFARNVAGVGQELPRAMLGGRPIVPGNTAAPPYWRFNRYWRQLYLSSYHVSSKTAPAYVGAIRRYQSKWITGYGSAIAALAESAMAAGVDSCPMQAVIVSGDTLLPAMRRSIESFFQCKCYDHYGQSEGVAVAMECSAGRMHVVPWVGVLEIVRPDGQPCLQGEEGEIVATSLLNHAMPLIRYRIGDYGAWAECQECGCGNPHPILTHLMGRVDDYLITTDGRKIGRLSTAMKRSPSIHSSQIVQDRPDHAFLLVRPGDGYRREHALAVRDDVLERVGQFDIELVEVPEIPKTERGKVSLVVRVLDHPGLRRTYSDLLKKSQQNPPKSVS